MSLGKQSTDFVSDRYLFDGKLENKKYGSSERDGLNSHEYEEASGKRRTSFNLINQTNKNKWTRRHMAFTSEWLPSHLQKENNSTDKKALALTNQNKDVNNEEKTPFMVENGNVKELQNIVKIQRTNLLETDSVHNYTFQDLKPRYVISESKILKGCPLMKPRANDLCRIDVEACKQRRDILRSDPDHRIQRRIELTDIYTGPDGDQS